MKILHAVLSQGFYGSERYCAELATEQARRGHDVEIMVHNAWSDCAREMRQAVALANTIGAGTLRLVAIPRWAPAWTHRLFARRALQRFAPDIVHTHLNPAGRRVGRIAQQAGIPHVATLHLSYDAREHAGCNGLVCIAEWQLDTLEGFDGEAAVVRNWLPATVSEALAADNSAAVARLRTQWTADDSSFVLGSVGRLAPEKGMDVLVRAFRAAFPRTDEPVRLVIIGDGEARPELGRLAASDGRIVLAGAQANVAPFYLAFDAYVSAARSEPFGLSIVEAMAAGCPLVLTRTQGPAEFAAFEHVLWAEPGDETSLASQLREAVARGWQQYRYDLNPFAPERAADDIEAFYRRVLARG
jgi:glycosyltransferase involved in cell wall biosynthesis